MAKIALGLCGHADDTGAGDFSGAVSGAVKETAMRRPVGVTILAALSVVAGIVAAFHALQYFGILPFVIGDLRFFGVDWLAGILFAINAVIYFWVASGLWTLKPWAWLFTVLISSFNLVLGVLALIGDSEFSELALTIVLSAVVLVYCLSSGVKQAFATGGGAQTV
jgi:hypothetical protein